MFHANAVSGSSAVLDRADFRPTERRSVADVAEAATDRVELSAEALRYGREETGAEAARVARIRAQIASGTYLTPEKLDATVERLMEEVLG